MILIELQFTCYQITIINRLEIIQKSKHKRMFNQNSFSIDSGNNQNTSFNFNSPQNKIINNSDSLKHNDDDYDFNANMTNYNFRDVNQGKIENQLQLEAQQRFSKQNHKFKKPYDTNATNKFLDRISQIPSSFLAEDQKPQGLLKQKIKVDYAFDHRKSQSQIALPSKPMQKFPNYSEINKSDFVSANLFSCMDAPDYQRDFQISPKVISRRNY